jgi:RNA polymerase-binding transcription factor DksA
MTGKRAREIREDLNRRLAILREDGVAMEARLGVRGEPGDSADAACNTLGQVTLGDGIDRASASIAELEAALERLEDGSYGTCEDCDKAIAEDRLAACPAAALCKSCQTARETGY